MKLLFGEHTTTETILASFAFLLLLAMYAKYLLWVTCDNSPDPATIFLMSFVTTVLLAIMAFPALGRWTSESAKEASLSFLALPKEGESLTFPVLAEFLGHQAFASLLITTIIVSGRGNISEFGGLLAGVFFAIAFILTLAFSVLSAFRVSHYFGKGQRPSVIALIASVIVVYIFLDLGTKSAM